MYSPTKNTVTETDTVTVTVKVTETNDRVRDSDWFLSVISMLPLVWLFVTDTPLTI